MKLRIYQVDAFTDHVFKGNPAAVCPLKEWLSEDTLLKIAAENNVSATVFYVVQEKAVQIRWFAPKKEIELCGHGTLAAAFVLHHCEKYPQNRICFDSLHSGSLSVTVQQGTFILNFPTDLFTETDLTEELWVATDKKPIAAYKGKTDYMLVFETQHDIETMCPNLPQIAQLKARGLIVTAKGTTADFVSRFFAPLLGLNEDPFCGSAHTTLTPYWAERLQKKELNAFQLSERSGAVHCRFLGSRVELVGTAVLYMKGEICI